MANDPRDVVVVTDTSVLVNFLRIDRMDLIARHSHRFVITGHAKDEITDHYPDQQARLNAALADGTLQEVTVAGEAALDLFRTLSETNRLGVGESAAIACAITNGYAIAIDDHAAAKRARALSVGLVILGSQDIMAHLIRLEVIAVVEADQIKDAWANQHRFKLGIATFGDLL